LKLASADTPSLLHRLEQTLSQLAQAESEAAVVRALDAYLQSLPGVLFATLTLVEHPSQSGRAEVPAPAAWTWLLAQPSGHPLAGAPRSAVSPWPTLEFPVRPGLGGLLCVYGPLRSAAELEASPPLLDGLRILLLTLGAHLGRLLSEPSSRLPDAPRPVLVEARVPSSTTVASPPGPQVLLDPASFMTRAEQHLQRHDCGAATLILMQLLRRDGAADEDLGDALIQNLLPQLLARLGPATLVSRLRPGEVAVFMLDSLSADEAREPSIKQREQALEGLVRGFVSGAGTAEIEVARAVWPAQGLNTAALLRHARGALYRGLPSPAPRVDWTSASLEPGPGPGNAMAQALQALVLSGELGREFRVVYQPQVNLKDMRLCGAEALLRWRSPEFGEVSPARFVPLLEETGLILPVGEWVLGEACRQVRRWADAGCVVQRLAVNLSARQLRSPTTAQAMRRVMVETGLMAWCQLEVEVTESTLMADREHVMGQLQELTGLGVRVAIDDFGQGHTSLGWLESLPISSIKVDRLFLTDLDSNPNHGTLAKAMFDLGRSLKLRVSAEGVETASQLDFIRGSGCEEAQGFYLARPLEAENFLADTGRRFH
jgi:EAL domain-containing protein (putative c-di-GMP-specific phosphodiesterase class I)